MAAPPPPAAPPPIVHTHPGLAFILGLIPGVGAIYNGQYVKGIIHAMVLGTLITVANASGHEVSPIVVMMVLGFWFYMPFEAYHTAKRRQAGLTFDEWSSVFSSRDTARAPIGAVLLIVLGILFLLNSLDLLSFREVVKFWPILLIFAGAYMLYTRLSTPGGKAAAPAQPVEAPHEQ
jgi:TM2 domain-containing membrane protein YozV